MTGHPPQNAFNIADRLTERAGERPYQRAVVVPHGRDRYGKRFYGQRTFAQLDDEATSVAKGLVSIGVRPGDKIALFVPPGLELLSLVFGLFRSGATVVLIDPGMGVGNLVECLAETNPNGFVAIRRAQLARLKFRKRVPNAKKNVCVGAGGGLLGMGYEKLLARGSVSAEVLPDVRASDPAAIIFTSGSTGPPKGVCYEHRMFDAQWQLIQQQYGIERGEIDLPAFPLFGLFNVAMGVTTVVPEMDFTRPADVDPQLIIEAINDQGVTQAFGSPAFWKRVGRYAVQNEICLPSLKRALSAGAPVPPSVLEDMAKIMTQEEASFHTPYGATESLPACTMSGAEVLEETAARTRSGVGTCVGKPFTGIDVQVIRIPDRPVSTLNEVVEADVDEVGEIIVTGPSVTTSYFERPVATQQSKLTDASGRTWHRIGDVGYFDDRGRLWFCGRKAHRVFTADGVMYPVQSEAIFNEHQRTARTALVGHRLKDDDRCVLPVLVVEPKPGEWPRTTTQKTAYVESLLALGREHDVTASVQQFVFMKQIPVDTRHNSKINRDQLGEWTQAHEEKYSL